MNTQAKILVVDDNHDTADSLRDLLELWGYNTRAVYDGFEALESAKSFLPDIIILEIGLPRLNGYQLAGEFRKDVRYAGSILVAVTGYAQLSDKKRAIDSGFDFFFSKPANPDQLKNLLNEISISLKDAPAPR